MSSHLFLDPIPIPNSINPYSVINTHRSINPDYSSFSFNNNSFISSDPRTFDSPRSMHLSFNYPPLQSSFTQPQYNLNHIKTNHIGYYPSYKSIYGGDITYYSDIQNDDPHNSPTFFIPSYTEPTILVDPMGSIKPYYKRIPRFKNKSLIYDYSFDQDQCEFRENLIASQQDSLNTSNYGAYQLFSKSNNNYLISK